MINCFARCILGESAAGEIVHVNMLSKRLNRQQGIEIHILIFNTNRNRCTTITTCIQLGLHNKIWHRQTYSQVIRTPRMLGQIFPKPPCNITERKTENDCWRVHCSYCKALTRNTLPAFDQPNTFSCSHPLWKGLIKIQDACVERCLAYGDMMLQISNTMLVSMRMQVRIRCGTCHLFVLFANYRRRCTTGIFACAHACVIPDQTS